MVVKGITTLLMLKISCYPALIGELVIAVPVKVLPALEKV